MNSEKYGAFDGELGLESRAAQEKAGPFSFVWDDGDDDFEGVRNDADGDATVEPRQKNVGRNYGGALTDDEQSQPLIASDYQ